MNNTGTRAALLAVLTLSLLVAGGCRRRAPLGSPGGGLDHREYSQLMRYATRHTGCGEAVLTPTLISTAPNVYSVTGCAQPVEYWQHCSRRRCRWRRIEPAHETAAEWLQCQPTMVQQQMTAAPTTRTVVGCGQALTLTLGCDGRTCVWNPAMQGQQQVYAQTPAAPPPPRDVQVGGGASMLLSAQVQAQREAVLSCVDPGASLTLSLRWTAEGSVLLQLPPELAGTASEGCIQAALGALQVAAQAPGQVRVPVR